MKDKDFRIGIKAVWFLVIGSFLLPMLGVLAENKHWEFSQFFLTVGLTLFFSTWIIILSDMIKNKIYNKTFLILTMFISIFLIGCSKGEQQKIKDVNGVLVEDAICYACPDTVTIDNSCIKYKYSKSDNNLYLTQYYPLFPCGVNIYYEPIVENDKVEIIETYGNNEGEMPTCICYYSISMIIENIKENEYVLEVIKKKDTIKFNIDLLNQEEDSVCVGLFKD